MANIRNKINDQYRDTEKISTNEQKIKTQGKIKKLRFRDT